MIVNRFILRKFGLSEYDIGRMQGIARCSSVRMFDKMAIADNGHLVLSLHFDIFEWIEMQRERIKVLRSIFVKTNQELLDRVEKAFENEMTNETNTANTTKQPEGFCLVEKEIGRIEMREIVEELKKWREDRNMQDNEFILETEVANMLKEVAEALEAKTDEHKAEEICDVAVFSFNGLAYLKEDYKHLYTEDSSISRIAGCLVDMLEGRNQGFMLNVVIGYCKTFVSSLGYDFQKMMLEKIKVLHSRVQSPTQAKDWAENGASGKWEKSTFPEHIAMVYKPDFESCRIAR